MNLIILGPSGSGKGTQARLLCDKLKLEYISMGDLLRAAARTRKDIDEWINKKGELVPDEITFSVLKEHLEKNKNLFKIEPYEHEYPHCWRCQTPLIYYARNSWFVHSQRE